MKNDNESAPLPNLEKISEGSMSSEEHNNNQQLIERLSNATQSLDVQDLTALAEMHAWCETLMADCGEQGDHPAPDIAENSAAVAKTLEELIMGAIDDVEAATKSIIETVNSMTGNSVDKTTGADSTPADSITIENSELEQLFDNMAKTGAGIDKDDLTAMAKMHGWCESALEIVSPEGDSPNPKIAEILGTLASSLEGLILGTVDEPENTIVSLNNTISLFSPGGASESEQEAAADSGSKVLDELSTEEVTDRLDKVFAEPVAQPESPGEKVETALVEKQEAAKPEADEVKAETTDQSLEKYVAEPLNIDDSELEFVGGFTEEAQEHIEAIESALLEVEQAPNDSECINDLFRPFHTIKGMAGFLNLRDVASLTHEVETVLDQGRRGERAITSGIIDLVFEVVDILKNQLGFISEYVSNPTGGPVPQPPVDEMIDRLRGVIAGTIKPNEGQPAVNKPTRRTGETLVAQGEVEETAVNAAVAMQAQEGEDRKIGEVLVDMGVTTPEEVEKAVQSQEEKPTAAGEAKPVGPTKTTAGEQSVRVDTAKLDALVDMVGELVIAQTLVGTNPLVNDNPKLSRDSSQVSKIVRDVQEVAMSMRMVPIKTTFQKMARLVRDLSRKSGKKVHLEISGEETELDKNVIQQIGDPLVHMVRNAIDHGIEKPDRRKDSNKPETGNVQLSAFHHSGSVVIEIRDDGKGLDPAALIAKGIERGVIAPDAELTDEEAYQLIFAPGFSTAAEITDISGRGVGMDVVRRNIEQLRGKVEISSKKGKGSVFSIRLPLTLAIIDGMVIRVGDQRFIIATTMIEQSLRPTQQQITSVQHRGEVLQIRGKLVPLIQLGQLFGDRKKIDPTEAMVIISPTDCGEIGLVVDELIDQQQVVIKSLGEKFANLHGISGAAILGDGRVGLILDPSGIEEAHKKWLPSADMETSPLDITGDFQENEENLSEQTVFQDNAVSGEPTETDELLQTEPVLT